MVLLSATYNRVKQVRILIGLLGGIMRRTLNWNKRHKPVTSRGFFAPRDKTRNAPRLSNGRWVPVNTRIGDVNEWG